MGEARDMIRHAGASGREFLKMNPETMNGFSDMFAGATKEGVISSKTKEMMVVAIGIAKQCKYCIAVHIKKAIKAGMSRDELNEVCMVASAMGGGPGLMYAKVALDYFDELSENKKE